MKYFIGSMVWLAGCSLLSTTAPSSAADGCADCQTNYEACEAYCYDVTQGPATARCLNLCNRGYNLCLDHCEGW